VQDAFELQLREAQEERVLRGLQRKTVLDGAVRGLDFGGNDYLGLAGDSVIADAMVAAIREFGTGGRSARLLGGGSVLHEQCEASVAAWLKSEAALLFPSGYQANVGLIGALVGRSDAIISDRENHASLIDGARLSRARIFVHKHCDLADLERCLRDSQGAGRRVVLTEGIFSMGGDRAPLAEIDSLCRLYDAWLVVDEAHSVGLLGPEGAGAWADASVSGKHRLCARTVTGGKSLGVGGAFVVGSAALRAQLIHTARSFLFTTAPPPSLAGGLLVAVDRCRKADNERRAAIANARRLASHLSLPEPAAAIVPIPMGDASRAVSLQAEMCKHGFYTPAVRPPTVAHGDSRLRVVCHARHDEATIDRLAELLRGRSLVASPQNSQPMAPLTCIVGTDTGVGKTVVSALLLRAAQRHGAARYYKPVQTGDEDDAGCVKDLAEADDASVLGNFVHYPLPASPHEAAAAVNTCLPFKEMNDALVQHRRASSDRLFIEFAGGLMVPLMMKPLRTQADWLVSMGADIVLVARSGLGTLNHTMLTIEALRARHLRPRALFLVGDAHHSNAATLREIAQVDHIYELPMLQPLSAAALDSWLQEHDLNEWLDV
jgi:8-amino-7-oxononanoate synthase